MENYSTLKQYAYPSDYKFIKSLGIADIFDIACKHYESKGVSPGTIKAMIHTRVNRIIDQYTGDLILRIANTVIEYNTKEHKIDE